VGASIFDTGIRELNQLAGLYMIPRCVSGLSLTFSALSCVLGFLLLIRFLSDRIASLGCTVLERMTSEISRLRAISSLQKKKRVSQFAKSERARRRDDANLQTAACRFLYLFIQGSVRP